MNVEQLRQDKNLNIDLFQYQEEVENKSRSLISIPVAPNGVCKHLAVETIKTGGTFYTFSPCDRLPTEPVVDHTDSDDIARNLAGIESAACLMIGMYTVVQSLVGLINLFRLRVFGIHRPGQTRLCKRGA